MQQLLKFILRLLNMLGMNPYRQSLAMKINRVLVILVAIHLNLKNVLEIVFNWRGFETISKLYIFPCVFIYLVKMLTLSINNTRLKNILDTINNFWLHDRFGPEIEKTMTALHAKIYRSVLAFFSLMLAVSVIFTVAPYVISDRSLLFSGYEECDLQTSPCFEISHLLQTLALYLYCIPGVIGFDNLFIYFVAEAYCTIELLKHGLNEMKVSLVDDDDTELHNKVGEFVNQHAIVLNFIADLRDFYNGVLLAQSWASLGALIYSLYMLTLDGTPRLDLSIKYIALFFLLCCQLLIYCYGGTILMEQTLTMADEAYNVEWWKKTQPKFRKKVLFIIERSQKPEKLLVGKMMDLNLECFVTVLRNAFSVYTLLQTLENKTLL